MLCNWLVQVVQHLDGDLQGEEVVSHVQTCPSCRAFLNLLAEVSAQYRRVPLVAPDPSTVDELLRRLRD